MNEYQLILINITKNDADNANNNNEKGISRNNRCSQGPTDAAASSAAASWAAASPPGSRRASSRLRLDIYVYIIIIIIRIITECLMRRWRKSPGKKIKTESAKTKPFSNHRSRQELENGPNHAS